ncbi:MAG: GLPGLI family protein [Bacteroidales bacterium]|nr:GLPGLI family protein [Bacteroidales bacterium]
MKMLLIISTLFFLSFNNIVSPDEEKVVYEVRYELKYQPDSTDNKTIKTEDMLLFIGKEKSMFLSYIKYYGDSVFKSYEGLEPRIRNKKTIENRKGSTAFKFYIYKDYNQKMINNYHLIFGDMYNFDENIQDFKWEIFNEFEDYHGYNCQKASTYYGGRQWEVWFTKEIPISDGPYKFSGLPGLILKAKDTRNHYVFELVHVKNAEDYKTIYLGNYCLLHVNRCQYLQALKHHQDNLAATITAGTVNADPQKIQEIVEREKRKNNPIELKCD